jgi:hypothetical protein
MKTDREAARELRRGGHHGHHDPSRAQAFSFHSGAGHSIRV